MTTPRPVTLTCPSRHTWQTIMIAHPRGQAPRVAEEHCPRCHCGWIKLTFE